MMGGGQEEMLLGFMEGGRGEQTTGALTFRNMDGKLGAGNKPISIFTFLPSHLSITRRSSLERPGSQRLAPRPSIVLSKMWGDDGPW